MEITQNYTATPTNKGNIAWFTFAINMEGAQTTLPAVDMYIKEITIDGPNTSGTFNVVYMNIWEVTSQNSYTYLGTSTNSAATAVNTSATWSFKHIKMSTSKEYLITLSQAPQPVLTGLTATRMALYPLTTDMDHASSAQTSVSSSASVIHFIPILTLVLTDDPERGSVKVEKGFYKNLEGIEMWMPEQTVKFGDLISGQSIGDFNKVFAVQKDTTQTLKITNADAPTGDYSVSVQLDGTVCLPESKEYILGSPADQTGLNMSSMGVNSNALQYEKQDSDNRLQMSDKFILSGFSSVNAYAPTSATERSSWTTVVKYKTGTLVSGTREQILCCIDRSFYRGISMYHTGSTLSLGMSIEGSSTWDICDPTLTTSSVPLQSDTWYFIKIVYDEDNSQVSWYIAETTESATIYDDITYTTLGTYSASMNPLTGNRMYVGGYRYYGASTTSYPSKGFIDLANSCFYSISRKGITHPSSTTIDSGWTAIGGMTSTFEKNVVENYNTLLNNFLTDYSTPAYICTYRDPVTLKDMICLVDGIDSTVTIPYRYTGYKVASAIIEESPVKFNSSFDTTHRKMYKDNTENATDGYYLVPRDGHLFRSATWPLNPAGGNVPVVFSTEIAPEDYTYDSSTDTYTISGTDYVYIGDYCVDCGPQMLSTVYYSPSIMPTISSDLIMSNFSDSNYFEIGMPDWLNSAWEAQFKFTTTPTGDWYKLVGGATDLKFGFTFGITSNKINFEATTNGTSWTVNIQSSTTVIADNVYWARIGWTGSVYYLDVSTDGVNYTREATASSSAPLVATQTMRVGSTWLSDRYWRGTLDLKESWIKSGNRYVWRGAIPFESLKAPEGI